MQAEFTAYRILYFVMASSTAGVCIFVVCSLHCQVFVQKETCSLHVLYMYPLEFIE